MTKKSPARRSGTEPNAIRSLHLVLRHSQARALWAELRGCPRAEEDYGAKLPPDIFGLTFSITERFEDFILINNILLLED